MRGTAFAAFVTETADHGQVLTQRLEGLQDKWKVEITADLLRLPFILEGAMRKVDEAQPGRGSGGGLGQRRTCRNHRIQQR